MEILLLTENILAEENFQNKLQQLGHEVFVNKSFLQNIEDILKFKFDVCIISNTISKSRNERILSKISQGNMGLLFECETSFGKENPYISKITWVAQDDTLETIKEKVEYAYNVKEDNFVKEDNTEKNLNLSSNEQRVFSFLSASENEAFSREKICKHVWDGDCTSSQKSQLSVLVKRINRKMKENSILTHEIRTLWGKGYAYSRID
ncbi:winged helix-turn-helix domain-containing protein [Enterococcus sp. AZ196]|uniref:winged helix-turn-helix domain-containing protein n=1 Tax=Enterococcus sp. AZ196 TaxID=2774659 RepID=UPI003D2BCD87